MFSGVVKISDLDDYLKPAQECIILTSDKKENEKIVINNIDEFANLKNSDLIKKDKDNTAKIDLMDCLACNGCVTTSETILIQEHSLNNYLENISNHKLNIILISIHSLYSLSDKYNWKIEEILYKLSMYLKINYNIDHVIEYSLFTEYLLELAFNEYKNNNDNINLSSECPGWICYLEKVLGKDYFKYASKLKSSNVLASYIIKNIFSKIYSLEITEINLSLVAPCFDKKLEISREIMNNNEIYCNFVISTNELEEFINKENIFTKHTNLDIKILFNVDEIMNDLINNKISINNLEIYYKGLNDIKIPLLSSEYNNSLSYCFSIISKLINRDGYSLKEVKNIKNNDFKEFHLEKNGENIILAIINGFKNIQNLIRRVKTKKCKYKYVEVMACPGGCINGGGQIKNDKYKNNKEQLENMTNLLKNNKNIRNNLINWESLVGKEFMTYKFEDIKNKEKNPLTIKW